MKRNETGIKRLSVLLMATAVMSAGTVATAQDGEMTLPQHEISVGYGTVTDIEIIDVFTDVLVTGFSLGTVSTANKEFSGAINLQYLYRPERWLAFGCGATYEQRTQDCIRGSLKDDTREKVGEQTNRYFSVFPMVRFSWLNKKHVTMYSKVAVGMTFIGDKYKNVSDDGDEGKVESEKDNLFAYQLSPVGIQVGSKLCGFAELGFGRQGMFQFGLAYKFN